MLVTVINKTWKKQDKNKGSIFKMFVNLSFHPQLCIHNRYNKSPDVYNMLKSHITLRYIKKYICAIEPFLLQSKEILEKERKEKKESEKEGQKRKGNREEAKEGKSERNRSH